MSTSLAEQLQRLAVPQTANLKRNDKKRASILFDVKEAAGISKETIFQIGFDGFEELKSKNPVFATFENTLFHITAKHFERSVQTSEANEKLNKNLRRFFHLLSPYFLMNAAHKTLEWLVYRYQIHEYNKDDLILLILPYHDTNIFVRVLQIVDIKDNDKWLWLQPLQKPGAHLSKHVLYNHAASNPGFMQLVSDNLMAAIREHEKPSYLTVFFNFYCATFIGALENAKNLDESHIVQMLPSIVKGLRSEIPDFCASGYIILAKLLTKATLSDKILDLLLEKLTEINVTMLSTEALLVMIVLYQSQEHYTNVPAAAVRNLAEKKWFAAALRDLGESGCLIDTVVLRVLSATIRIAMEEVSTSHAKQFVNDLMNTLKLNESILHEVFTVLTTSYYFSMSYPSETVSWMKALVETIERQYPLVYDKEVSRLMKHKTHQREAFKRIIQNVSLHKQVVLFEQLYHPQPDIRRNAMQNLLEGYNKLKDREQEFIKNVFVDRLNDDDVLVVEETLEIDDEILFEVLNKEELTQICIKLLYKHNVDKLERKIIEKLAKIDVAHSDYEVIIAIFPYLLPLNERKYKTSRLLVQNFVPKCKVLKPLATLKKTDKKTFADAVTENLKAIKLDANKLIETIQTSSNAKEVMFKYSIALLLCKTSTEFDPRTLPILIHQIGNSHLKLFKHQEPVAKNKLSLEVFMLCIEEYITKCPKTLLHMYDFSKTCKITEAYVILCNFLLSGVFHKTTSYVNVCAKTFKVFLQYFAPNVEIECLLNYASADNVLVTSASKLRAMKSVHALIDEKQRKINLKKDNLIVPYLVICLENNNAEIRQVAIQCFESLPMYKHDYAPLVNTILNGKTEILQDVEQLPLMICNGKLQRSPFNVCTTLLAGKLEQNVPVYLKSGVIIALGGLDDLALFKKYVKYALSLVSVQDSTSQAVKVINVCIEQFTEVMAKSTTLTSELWDFIVAVLKNQMSIDEHAPAPAIAFINKINREMYNQFPNAVQTSLVDLIIELTTYSTNPEMLPAATTLFKHIDLDAVTILGQLHKMRDVVSPKLQTKLRRRISVVPTVDILDTNEWKKGITILEFVQDKKKVRNVDKLIPVLFDILKKCLDFDEQASVEYPKQLVLSSILHYCDKIDPSELPQNVFNMELVVQCIRASQNPQTHHHALLLLAKVASFIPSQVLLHIMAIFTFMGSSVLRHDDAYSFQIITKIIETIIPILVKEKSRENIISVLRVFVDVILDVPEHRRMPLYGKLLEQIGPKDNLYIFLLLIVEAHVLAKNKDGGSKRSDIAKSLCLEFPPEVVIFSCIQLIDYVKLLPVDKEDYKGDRCFIFDVNSNTPKQFRHFKYSVVLFASDLLASKDFVNHVARLPADDNEHLEELYKKMIVNVLTYIQTTTKVAELNANTPQSHYWKVMLHHAYDILDSLNALLTSQMFLLVIKGLMTHQLNTVKRRALELLNSKLHHNPDFFEDCEQSDLFAMIPPLIVIINEVGKDNLDADEAVIIQTALLSLKLFVRLLAADNQPKFVQILTFITGLLSRLKMYPNIMASAILCLAELCTNLRSHAIVALNTFMPALIKILKKQGKEEYPTLLLLSAVATLQKILDVLSLFLSPYLEEMLCEICSVTAKWNRKSIKEDVKTGPFIAKMHSIREKVAGTIPSRVLIPAVDATYRTLVQDQKYAAIGPLMDILSESMAQLKGGPDIQNNLPELTAFFMHALEFRTGNDIDNEQVCEVEKHTITAITNLILKLSESSFRPLYYKLYDWAVRCEQEKSEKIITFYAFSYAIANSLKGLFVLFAGHFLNNAAAILDSCNVSKNKHKLYFANESNNVQLLENTLKTLNLVFMYDSQKFINKERFDVLMQPIVDQLDNTLGDDYESRVRDVVIPTVINFTVATGDDALWKLLNYQILLKMRDVNPRIRMLALECLRDVCKKVGEDFLPLLPETIPFLAELLEDEEETIEKACQKTIQELEKVLGEPLQKYF